MIRPLTPDDISGALELCRTAGWNQLHQDWSRLIRYEPEGCFAAEVDGALVGTVTTTSYGTDLAWIGMMLVHERYRRRGIATELMNASLEYLDDRSVQCIKLDATPLGRPVYERLGFQAEWSFQRWECQEIGKPVDRATEFLVGAQFDLDRVAFAADRTAWLKEVAKDSAVCVRDGGFGMIRPGAVATYLGPVVAASPELALDVIDQLLQGTRSGPVFWDVMNEQAATIAASLGFSPIRDLTRMWMGKRLVSPPMNLQFAISDPGTG